MTVNLTTICEAISAFKHMVDGLDKEKYDAKFPSTLTDDLSGIKNNLTADAAKFNTHAQWLEKAGGVINDPAINKNDLKVIADRIQQQAKLYEKRVGKNAVTEHLLSSLNGLGDALNNVVTVNPKPRSPR